MSFRKLLLVSLVLAPAAHAADDLTFGANIWANFKYNHPAGAAKTAGFDLDRAYFKANYKFSDAWFAKTTTEISRHDGTSATKNLGVYVKNAYIQNKGMWTNGVMDFGLRQNSYVTYFYNFTGTRWLGLGLADTMKYIKTDDNGVAFSGDCMDKSVDYSLVIHNGLEGTTLAVTDDKLAVSGTVQYHLTKELGLLVDDTLSTAGGTNVISAALLAEVSMVKLAGEFTVATRPNSTADAPIAFGGTANVAFTDDYGLYGKFFTGTTAGKVYLGSSSQLSVGPTMSIVKGKVNTALVYDASMPTTGDASWDVRWQWAANF